jgi:hypothetical protein
MEKCTMTSSASLQVRSIAIAASLFWSAAAAPQTASFIKDCQPWIDKKGYSTDYIEQKTGKKQPGLAGSWRGNVPVQQVQARDVVLIALRRPGAQHAALVEEVRRNADGTVNAIRLSEWNWGRMTHERCLVTENFGRLADERWVEASAVAQVWRPSLPLAERGAADGK